MRARAVLCVLAASFGAAVAAPPDLALPGAKGGPPRAISVDDVARVRDVDSLGLSPDGRRIALFVRQGDSLQNRYRTGWFVVDVEGGDLRWVGDGGDLVPKVMPTGHMPGFVAGGEGRWSPDGKWIAHTLLRDGETQLWISDASGAGQRQVTRNASDIREFAWSEDGRSVYFTIGTARAELRMRAEARARAGYRYDQDFWSHSDLLLPTLVVPLETRLSTWVAEIATQVERPATETEQQEFKRLRAPTERRVWTARSSPKSRKLRLHASRSPLGADPIACAAEECEGDIKKAWWSEDGERVFFWRGEGINNAVHAFYSWLPSSGRVSLLHRSPEDDFAHCLMAAGDRVVCVRQTVSRPAHVAAIDLRTGKLAVIADPNPEYHDIRLGKVERFEWETPRLPWNEPGGRLEGLYPARAYGWVIFPPDFDPRRKYPVFIDPYMATGFRPLGLEHALHVYAANGMVVLRLSLPMAIDQWERLGPSSMKQLYDAELGFPHLTMLMQSTLAGLDKAAARGFLDLARVGIGGVSHGTFVPMYMLQKHDRIAAISISSPGWGPHSYYSGTQHSRTWMGRAGYAGWAVRPEGAGREFWRQIDLADHVGEIEAPMLMHLAAHEAYAHKRLIRHLADAGKPYDAYVFPGETHMKWQPAHLHSILGRNLDWFRFWLQDHEDSDPGKVEQYGRWRELRALQCRNPRSLRDYCAGRPSPRPSP